MSEREIEDLETARQYCIDAIAGTSKINAMAIAAYDEALDVHHVAHKYTTAQRWAYCAIVFSLCIDRETHTKAELTSLRAICKRILATHDTSAYAKGSEQELWREFKREVEG